MKAYLSYRKYQLGSRSIDTKSGVSGIWGPLPNSVKLRPLQAASTATAGGPQYKTRVFICCVRSHRDQECDTYQLSLNSSRGSALLLRLCPPPATLSWLPGFRLVASIAK